MEHTALPARSGNTVLYTGRIERRKGSITLLHSAGIAARHRPDIQYIVAGARHSSVSEREVARLLEDASVRDHVQILGHVAWHDLPPLYANADVFVMPSLYETFGISMVEAMAFGLPVVATRAGAMPEVVEDGVTGVLVPPGDAQALADAILSLLNDRGRACRMGEAGRDRVATEFTVDRAVDQTLALYREVLAASSPSPDTSRPAGLGRA
jgi:glycosyltransferase involved in cell wall biosynthesis